MKLQRLYQEQGLSGILRKLYLKGNLPQHKAKWTAPEWLSQPFYQFWKKNVYAPYQKQQRTQKSHASNRSISVWVFENESSQDLELTTQSIQQQTHLYWNIQHVTLDTQVQAIEHSQAEWVLFVPAGVRLSPYALEDMATALQTDETSYDLIYGDHELILDSGSTVPVWKPQWSPWYLRSHNYIGNVYGISFQKLCEWAPQIKSLKVGLWFQELLWRFAAQPSTQALHVNSILYQVPPKTLLSLQASSKETTSMIKNHVPECFFLDAPKSNVTWMVPKLQSKPRVSILIPFRDEIDILKTALQSVFHNTLYDSFEVLLIDNQSSEATLQALEPLLQQHSNLRLLSYPHPFNYSAMNNEAVEQANGDFLLFLNNDIEVLYPHWLSRMLGYAQFPENGAIGAKLYYPNGWIQHAGIALGIHGIAGHRYRFSAGQADGMAESLWSVREVSAVTAACLMVRKAYFQQVGGFDEESLKVGFNDVDLCLKLGKAGYQNLVLPFVELIHHESLSRGHDTTPEKQARAKQEIAVMKKRWGSLLQQDPFDPFYLSKDAEDCFPTLHLPADSPS